LAVHLLVVKSPADVLDSCLQMWEALLDPKAWCLTIAMFGSSVPNGILTNFSGTIIKVSEPSQVGSTSSLLASRLSSEHCPVLCAHLSCSEAPHATL